MAPAAPKPAHRPDPQSPGQRNHGESYGASRTFAASNALTSAPPPYGNAAYDAALAQVRSKGIAPELAAWAPGPLRTPDETMIGVFWGYDGAKGIGTAPRLYNQIIREVIASRPGMTVAEQARLLALANVAMAEAGILAWREKYRHNFWRPVVGIRENDPSIGSAATPGRLLATCDPIWLPFGAPNSNQAARSNFTPPSPAYPSGHAAFGAAALGVARH